MEEAIAGYKCEEINDGFVSVHAVVWNQWGNCQSI